VGTSAEPPLGAFRRASLRAERSSRSGLVSFSAHEFERKRPFLRSGLDRLAGSSYKPVKLNGLLN